MNHASQPHDIPALDALTGGAFTAPTSGERAARVREWLASNPTAEQMQDVFRELSIKDKGAAKPLREKLDELRRTKNQETVASEWADKASALLALPKLNIADAMAWQRDAAKAGAPLSKEPLTALKTQLADRVKLIEDLQHRVHVQRESAVLLAQRIEVLSTKPWKDAQSHQAGLAEDVTHWQTQATQITQDGSWPSVDMKFPPMVESAQTQLLMVWDAFSAALTQTITAAADADAPLPPVPVWADEIRATREESTPALTSKKPKVDPALLNEKRAMATQVVGEALAKLEKEVAEGHGKASTGAAGALRSVLKEHGKLVDDAMEARVHAALVSAGELEGWQRWRADQIREDLVAKAEALLHRPEGQTLGGRKMQETLRGLRDQWKVTDQGGVPNHALWKRFDDACNEAYKTVESWLEKVKAESAEHKAQRVALIEEVKAFAAAQPYGDDLKTLNRSLHQFSDRWRDGGHLSEKAYAELQPQWKEALKQAAAPLEAAQKQSLERRHAMIEEANVLGSAPALRIDAVKALQQRWQAEAQSVPLDRKHEQKLWDAFRKPIDDAFNRKTHEREKSAAALSEHDRIVLEAAKTLEAANASGDGQQIRAAMNHLEAALRGQVLAQQTHQAAHAEPAPVVSSDLAPTADTPTAANPASTTTEPVTPESASTAAELAQGGATTATETPITADTPALPVTDAADAPSSDSANAQPAAPVGEPVAGETALSEAEAPKPAPKPAAKPVVAVRGDDRPGMKKSEPATAGRGGKFGDRKGAPGSDRGRTAGGRDDRRDDRREGRPDSRNRDDASRHGSRDERPAFAERGPRLGDAAFRAQRDALEHAQAALKKLAMQAHGEVLTQLLGAWEHRAPDQMPSGQDLGKGVPPAVRTSWVQAIASAPAGDASENLLRLEMAAELPTPAEQLTARRALQLKLLTQRNQPSPQETAGQDVAKILASPYDAQNARRLQNVLKAMLKK